MRKFKTSLWPTLGTLVGFLLLLALGTWQASRFVDRLALEEERDERLAQPGSTLETAKSLDAEDDFTRITARGKLDLSRTVLFKFRNYQSRPGYWLASPMVFEDDSALLVNRGWVPMETGRELARELGETGEVEVSGVVRIPDQIISDDDTRAKMAEDSLKGSYVEWSSFDVSGVYAALPYDTPDLPAVLVLEEQETSHRYPIASADHITKPYLTSEKHLGYAITWYTLALCLLALWVAAGFGLVSSRPRSS